MKYKKNLLKTYEKYNLSYLKEWFCTNTYLIVFCFCPIQGARNCSLYRSLSRQFLVLYDVKAPCHIKICAHIYSNKKKRVENFYLHFCTGRIFLNAYSFFLIFVQSSFCGLNTKSISFKSDFDKIKYKVSK